MKYKLEILCFNIASCILAQQVLADRIELCDNPGEGGTTPGFGFIKMARERLKSELYIMIRPRGGNFLYSPDELEIMKKDIAICKDLGCDGVVFGMLNVDGSINKRQVSRLVEFAYPLGVTFHRAFDHALNPFEALEDIIETGCERLLTSGHKTTALEGMDLISQLVRQSDERLIIMPGSGIRGSNVAELARHTGSNEFHSSARKTIASEMTYINKNMDDMQGHVMVDENEINLMRTELNNFFNIKHEV